MASHWTDSPSGKARWGGRRRHKSRDRPPHTYVVARGFDPCGQLGAAAPLATSRSSSYYSRRRTITAQILQRRGRRIE